MHSRIWVVASLFAAMTGSGMVAVGAEPHSLFFEGDMVRGGSAAGATGPACVLASEFKRREVVVWRIRVRDAKGQNVDASTLKSLVVELPGGQSFPARFGPHPKGQDTDQFWSTSWTVPADYPTGTFGYKVVATDKDGGTQTWAPFKVAPSQLTIIAGDVTFTK
ncbi:MAG: hypothetical protein ABI343_09840 [Burkholderiaceae bacterium]